MKLNTNANGYIIVYSCLMVVIVAFLLAFVSSALKPQQDINVALDKKKQVLAALNIRDLSDSEAEKKYSEVVKKDEAFALNSSDYKEGRLAIYECEVDGAKKYVVPVYGMGLWGPIWGYVAVNDDCNTVYGAYFNHDSETAGLGAEIRILRLGRTSLSARPSMMPTAHRC
jgi:Na+-transporting NADH:ubiquinone oxidoreductase subunit C